jgi:NADPH2:quinone reductase
LVDVVGGDTTNALKSLALFGRVMVVGFASGEIPMAKVSRLLLTNTDVRRVESDYLWREVLSRMAGQQLMKMATRLHQAYRPGRKLAEKLWFGFGVLSARSVVGRTVPSLPPTCFGSA